MNEARSSQQTNRIALATTAFLACVTLLGAIAAFAQRGSMSPNQDERDGVSAGGKWTMFQADDKMTGAKRARFELLADHSFREDPNYPPRVELFCEAGKLKSAEFNPGMRLPPPNRPGFWGQPQLEVMVRVDDWHGYKGWNWVRGNFLSMDKNTTRGLIDAQIFNVELPTQSGRQIAEFSPSGLDLNQVRQSCDLMPKKPSKD